MRRIAYAVLSTIALMSAPVQAKQEPDGSRPSPAIPSFHGEPAPPEWLRAASHAVALVDTRHYLYEVYGMGEAADPRSPQWIVRYVMLPEGNEAYREIEQVFLFDGDPKHKPKSLNPGDLMVEPRHATWKSVQYKLVDRRDLVVP